MEKQLSLTGYLVMEMKLYTIVNRMDGQMGWIDQWINGWMDGWID